MIDGTRVKPEWAATAGQWNYVRCSCVVNIATSGGVSFTYQCEACGNTNLRFIHTLEHREDERTICVGIECACVLMDDYEIPHLAENETKRQERWRREVYHTPGRCRTTIEDLEKRGKL